MAEKEKYESTTLDRSYYREIDMHRVIYNLLSEGKTNLESLNDGISECFPEYASADIFRISFKPPRTLEGSIIEIKYNDKEVKSTIEKLKTKEAYVRNKLEGKAQALKESFKDEKGLECVVRSILMHNNPSKRLSEECKKNNIELIKYSEPTMYFEKY